MDRKPHMLRRKFLIYPKFQLSLIVVNSLIMLTVFGAVAIQTARTFSNLKQMGLTAQLSPSHAYFKFLDFQANTLYFNLGIALVAAFCLSGFITLVLSHRLAGPIVRLRNYFRDLGKADPKATIPELRFRRNDFFMDLPPEINQALSKLQTSNGKPLRVVENKDTKKAA